MIVADLRLTTICAKVSGLLSLCCYSHAVSYSYPADVELLSCWRIIAAVTIA